MLNISEDEIIRTWDQEKRFPEITVFCLTYNHGKFIEECLDGFIMQKSTVPFEVLVHDDASTDNTADIIRKYAERYPRIIKPIYEIENQYSQKKGIITNILLPLAKGRYFAWCEGDDYWIDHNKLQKQYEALETHERCSACFCRVGMTRATEPGKVYRVLPYLQTGNIEIDSESYIKYCLYPSYYTILPFQISGFMVRGKLYADYLSNPPTYKKYFDVGDIPLFLHCGLKGNIYLLDEIMSHYRTANPDSTTGSFRASQSSFIKHQERESAAIKAFDEYTNYKYHEYALKSINLRAFKTACRKNDLPAMKMREYREFYRCLPRKEIVLQYLSYYFPRLKDIYKAIKKRANKPK